MKHRYVMRCFVWLAVMAAVSINAAHAEPRDGDGEPVRPNEVGPVSLTAAQRQTRAELIRDTAAAVGMTNAALLAGIGEVETGFAHCWSEATWACKGPSSSSCNGEPVIAGGSDGPCSLQQGGLGMFQFDSGTFTQTIATYGADIVTMQGNVNAVIPFLITRAIQSVDGVTSEAEALAWMNSITIQDGDPQYEAWLYFVAWRYNGCMGCTTQINKYRNGTNKLRDEFGPDFWTTTRAPDSCELIPPAGRTIDDADRCFRKSGTATSWYLGDRGTDGACVYTYTTDEPQPDNHATWELRFEADGRYRVQVYTDGGVLGQTHQAKYVVTHADGTTEVVIDQAAVDGFRDLGEFAFTAGAPFAVSLGDNTGEPYVADAKIGIAFDAVRVLGAGRSGDGDADADAMTSGCSTGTSSSGALVGFGLAFAVWRRRRSRVR